MDEDVLLQCLVNGHPDIPASLVALCECVGAQNTVLLWKKFKGGPVYISRNFYKVDGKPRSSQLIESLPGASLQALSDRFPGKYLTIPLCKKLLAIVRNQQLAEEYDCGATAHSLAEKYNLHIRTVRRNVAARSKPDA